MKSDIFKTSIRLESMTYFHVITPIINIFIIFLNKSPNTLFVFDPKTSLSTHLSHKLYICIKTSIGILDEKYKSMSAFLQIQANQFSLKRKGKKAKNKK